MEVRYRSNKLKEREDLRTPGPNSYRLPVESSKKDPSRTASPAWGFTTSPKSTSAEKLGVRASTPGPGAYEYSPKQGLNSCPRATIGNAARSSAHLLRGALVPSPFVYNTSAEYCMRKEPAYTIGKQLRPNTATVIKSKSTTSLPGPADYKVDEKAYLRKSPVTAIPNEKREM